MPTADAVLTREVIFAYLFGPPRVIRHEEVHPVHAALCRELTWEDISFQYKKTTRPTIPGEGPSGGFSVEMARQEGRGGFRLALSGDGAEVPIKLLMSYVWPGSVESAKEAFKVSTQTVLNELNGPWTLVLAEARIRAECAIRSPALKGSKFLRDTVVKLDPRFVDGMGGDPSFVAVTLENEEALPPSAEDPTANPRTELRVEVLRENPESLYMEGMRRWSQVPDSTTIARGDEISMQIRTVDPDPSAYIASTYDMLRDCSRALRESKT